MSVLLHLFGPNHGHNIKGAIVACPSCFMHTEILFLYLGEVSVGMGAWCQGRSPEFGFSEPCD